MFDRYQTPKSSIERFWFSGWKRIEKYLEHYKIYLYHRVLPYQEGENPFLLKVSPSLFEDHLKFFKKSFNICFADDLVRNKFKGKSSRDISITFDDGYFDNYEYAFPLIKKYKVPVTIFLTTSFVDNHSKRMLCDRMLYYYQMGKIEGNFKELTQRLRFLKPEEQDVFFQNFGESIGAIPLENDRGLTWEQVLEMYESGLVRFEVHGHTHANLKYLSKEEIVNELKQCYGIIEEKLNYKSKIFAYPFGSFEDIDQQVIDVVRECDFEAAFMAYGNCVNTRLTHSFLLDRVQQFEPFV